MVASPSTFSPFGELATEGVVFLPFAIDLVAVIVDTGVTAAFGLIARFALAGVATRDARDGFFKLPGLTGLLAVFRAGVWTWSGGPVAFSRKEAIRSSLLSPLSWRGVDSISSGCVR